MPERLLILGANGMLGGSLFRYFSSKSDLEVVGSVRSEAAAEVLLQQGFENIRVGTDVCDTQLLSSLIQEVNPTIVLNCIGVIKQLDKAKVPVPSIEINSLLPHRLAELCGDVGARMVHFSTDCIFSGRKGMYKEGDTPDATDLYGRSKLLGEVDYGDHLTLRTSIIGHELNSSVSLVDWFLSQTGKVRGFSKAIFSGLPTIYVAEFLYDHVINSRKLKGLYHLSVEPIDKNSLLNLIKAEYGLKTEIDEYVGFEIDRSLDSSMLRREIGFEPAKWPELIEKMHDEYQEYFA